MVTQKNNMVAEKKGLIQTNQTVHIHLNLDGLDVQSIERRFN